MQKQYSIIVNAPISKAFSSISEQRNINRHMDGKIRTEFKNSHDFSDPVGSKFHQDIAGMIELDGEIIAYNKPLQLGIGIQVSGLTGTIFYELEHLDDSRTNLVFNLEIFDGNPAKKILLAAVYPLFESTIHTYLKNLKKLAEEDTVQA